MVLRGVNKMKMVLGRLALCFGVVASSANAEVVLTVDGNEYTLTALMENCQTMGDDPTAQVACFNAVSALLDQQSAEPEPTVTASVPDALAALQAVAQYENDETGLIVQGDGCNAQILYYGNYFHVSRRNVSTIDLFSAQLDMAQVDLDQTVQAASGAANVVQGALQSGAVAAIFGGEAVSSAEYGIAPKSARMSVSEYAATVADQLAADADGAFDFVLVHPAKQQSSAEIWDAFKAYTAACQQ